MRLGVAWVPGQNAQYRAFQPARAMAQRGHEVIWPPDEQGAADPLRLRGCDVVHVFRRSDEQTRRVLASLLRAGAAVTFDNDDDFTALPKEAPNFKHVGGVAGQHVFAATVKVARVARWFSTTTEVLAEKYRRAGVSRVEVIGNYLVPDVLRPRWPHDGIVIGWVAGLDHLADVARIPIRDALQRLVATYDHVRVECIGVDLRLEQRYRHDPFVPFEAVPGRIGDFDIGIAPLADIPFNRARSDIKLKEYAASGVPWLASPVGPYVGLGEAEGGRLVTNDGWLQALERLVTHADERERLARAGAEWAGRQTMHVIADRWERLFLEAAASASPRPPSPAVRVVVPRPGGEVHARD